MIMVLQIISFERNNNINIKEIISFKYNKLITDSQYFFLFIKLKFEKCLCAYIPFQ